MTLLEIGKVIRPHGLRGEVVVDLVTNRLERLAPGSVLLLDVPGAAERSLEVLSARPHQGRYLVVFKGVESREAAEELRACPLKADAASDPDELYVHQLIGAEVRDQFGTVRGLITGVEANPASDLLVVDGRYYVPARFVTAHEGSVVRVEVPEGLFDD
jgi:16S rRNA processing protein RimM